MSTALVTSLRRELAVSNAAMRKAWAAQIIGQGIRLEDLLGLLMSGGRTAQRFMWLIGDLCEADPTVVEPCLPVLLSLRDQMPFPGMRRSLAKWLLLTGVPAAVEREAVRLLRSWMEGDQASIAARSYAAKALVELAKEGRVGSAIVRSLIEAQARHPNRAFGGRMEKLLDRLVSQPGG